MPASQETVPDIRIASPCKVSWDTMKGDEYMRFCGQCQLNVYNLSALSAREITDLVKRKEGRLCVRLYRRADGTILTQDCPVGLKWVRRKVAVIAAACLAILTQWTGLSWLRGGSVMMGDVAPIMGKPCVTPPESDPRWAAGGLRPPPPRPPAVEKVPEVPDMGEAQVEMGR